MRRLIILGTLLLLARKVVHLLAYLILPFHRFGQFFQRYLCRWCVHCCGHWRKLPLFYRVDRVDDYFVNNGSA